MALRSHTPVTHMQSMDSSLSNHSNYAPSQAVLTLGDSFYDRAAPAAFPEARLRFRNDRAADMVGLGGLDDAAWVDHFAHFRPLPGSLETPLALRYHGHQFRVYNPELGDGRGFLFAQLHDRAGRLMDLGTKGSGQTPWSRFGDGRLTLKGGVREVLATEMLEALGVETSRSFSLVETGEELVRGDEPSPTRSAVLVRLSHGHVRIGTFQRLAYERDAEGMARLIDYVLQQLHGEAPGSEPAVQLLANVVARTARLAAQYMAAGFVHGVLNTDNINVTGESFDYGPWRFAPMWDPAFTAAYFDHAGLYAFGRQPEAIHWDAMQLAVALRLVSDAEPLIAALDGFAPAYRAEIARAMLWRLGVQSRGEADDHALVQALERALRDSDSGLDRLFFDAFGGQLPAGASYAEPAWEELRARLATHLPRKPRDHPYWSVAVSCSMLIDEVEALWSAIADRDDWSPFHAKIASVREMGQALA